MSSDNSLEPFWWIFNILEHSKLNISISNDVRISFIFLLSLDCSLLVLKSRLVEVYFLCHDNTLYRY